LYSALLKLLFSLRLIIESSLLWPWYWYWRGRGYYVLIAAIVMSASPYSVLKCAHFKSRDLKKLSPRGDFQLEPPTTPRALRKPVATSKSSGVVTFKFS